MKHFLIGYAGNPGIRMMTEQDARSLSHINLAFGVIRNGLLDTSKLTVWEDLRQIRAWNPDIRIVLSVGGWAAGGFSEMASTPRGISAFADSCRQAMDRHGLDGIDIDWEYPCSSAAGIASNPADKANFTALMRALRGVAGDRIVSIAAGAGPYFTRNTEMDKVAAVCDYIQLMTYDMRGGTGRQAGHHTGLDASRGDEDGMTVRRAAALFHKAGVPRDKIVIGAAFYSRKWDNVPDINRGLLQQAGSVGNYGPGYDRLLEEFIDKNGWVSHWDEDAKAPFLFNGRSFISYDDPRSVTLKCRYLKQEGLRGIMYWEHSSDSTRALLNAMAAELGRG